MHGLLCSSFVTQAPDSADRIINNAEVMIVSRESDSAEYLLGAWGDRTDCYYAGEYLDGDNAAMQKWYVQKLTDPELPLRYGDPVYLANAYYADGRLTRDERWIAGSRLDHHR